MTIVTRREERYGDLLINFILDELLYYDYLGDLGLRVIHKYELLCVFFICYTLCTCICFSIFYKVIYIYPNIKQARLPVTVQTSRLF